MIERIYKADVSLIAVPGERMLHFQPVGFIFSRVDCPIQFLQVWALFMDVCQNPFFIVSAQVQVFKLVFVDKAGAGLNDLPEIRYPGKTRRHKQDGFYPVFMEGFQRMKSFLNTGFSFHVLSELLSSVLMDRSTVRCRNCFRSSRSRRIRMDFVEIFTQQSISFSCSRIPLVIPFFSLQHCTDR